MRSRFIENCPGEADSKEDENNINDTNLTIRPMTIDDFEQVHSLWMEIHGFGIRSVDDSKEGVERFIRRNPATSMVAVCDGKIVGAILCGHDGRRAGLYHVCVQENYRKHGIGQKLVERCLEALKAEKISKVNLIAFKQNEIGNRFWQSLGWKYCDNVNYYEYVLNEENITVFNP